MRPISRPPSAIRPAKARGARSSDPAALRGWRLRSTRRARQEDGPLPRGHAPEFLRDHLRVAGHLPEHLRMPASAPRAACMPAAFASCHSGGGGADGSTSTSIFRRVWYGESSSRHGVLHLPVGLPSLTTTPFAYSAAKQVSVPLCLCRFPGVVIVPPGLCEHLPAGRAPDVGTVAHFIRRPELLAHLTAARANPELAVVQDRRTHQRSVTGRLR